MKPKSEPQYPLIDYLEKLVRDQDRGAMAALRRGVGKAPGTAMEMHRYVAPFLPKNSFPRVEENYYVIAALFAYWHQGETAVTAHPPDNLGASLARLRTQDTGPSLDLRFTALLKSHRDDLPTHLRQVVGLLKSKSIPVDWRQLWWDLLKWNREDGWVQRDWAKSFWGREAKTETEPTTNDQND